MKSLNQSIRLAAFFAFLSLVAAGALYAYWFHYSPNRPLILSVSEEIVDRIRKQDEIERLRTGALRLAEMQTEMAKHGNAAVDRIVNLAAIIALLAALELLVIFALLFKVRRQVNAAPATRA